MRIRGKKKGDKNWMMHGIRQRILDMIRRNEQVTVTELAAALSMAPVSVRYHLDILQNNGLITITGVKRKPRAGRPEQVYILTEEALERFPNNYRVLAAGLLAELQQRLAGSTAGALAQIVASRLAAQAPLPVLPATFPARIEAVTHYLNDLSYAAQWQRTDHDHYLLQINNCPYAALVVDFPELCQMDKLLVEKLVGQPVQMHCHKCNGESHCRYVFDLSTSSQNAGNMPS